MENAPITASGLRKDIYRLLDQVLETGVSLEIERRGKILKIVAPDPPDRLGDLPVRDFIVGEPDDLVHLDWSSEWKP
jgi:hypothetical protein